MDDALALAQRHAVPLAIGGAALALFAYQQAQAPPAFHFRPIANPAPSLVDPSAAELTAMVAELKANFKKKGTSSLYDKGRWDYAWRVHQLQSILLMVEENDQELLEAAKKDIGRAESEWFIEKQAIKSDLRLLISGLYSWMQPKAKSTPLWMIPASSYVKAEPLGVTLVLGAWNYQKALSILPLAASISAGNAVVLKPSELASEQSKLLARLIPKYLDPEAVRVVEGGPEASKRIVEQPWDFVFYTGGGKVGALIGASCAARLIPFALELGGKSPTIIDKSANLLVSCRRIIQAKIVNSGQTCIAPDYIIVIGDKQREHEITKALAAEIRTQLGDDPKVSKSYARIVNDNHFARVQRLFQSGGKVVHGGKSDPSERYLEPTVVVEVPHDCLLMQEEIFGPILPVVLVSTPDEAIDFVTSRPKPLALYVFSEDKSVANHILDHTTSGSACVNEAVFQYVNSYLPFGGVGPSGNGSYHGEAGFLEFSHERSILARQTFGDIVLRYGAYLEKPWVQSVFEKLMGMG